MTNKNAYTVRINTELLYCEIGKSKLVQAYTWK